jgi:hypothetical protein
MKRFLLATTLAVAVAATGPAGAVAASGPTGKAAMSPPTNCKKIKNKAKRKRCLRHQQQG